ncbi:uncharacterized protein [Physcomitrium patens]|uniref:uncharacterized protein isoform X3 n=1 Tax=Physcomitrium patens TaxID=3218 RepID=UPI000D165801|nr:golgin subfamily A member 6-like protein 7 isoform X3 [Physcomitrium patens]|eukprot:XP_024395424.1 golgin subfamily A member 6-like protein 7 isoform X3 [Physcomitrella patens]
MDPGKKLFAESLDHIHLCQHPSGTTEWSPGCHSNKLKLTSFDDDSDWSDDQSSNDSASTVSDGAGAKVQELHREFVAKGTKTEVVSPLVRSIFENRKKTILDESQKLSRKEQVVSQRIKENSVEDYEKMVNKKVLALDEEVAIFKVESKRLKNLAKEHEEGLKSLAREKTEWEEQKKSQIQGFQTQQEEQVPLSQIEKLKKEKKILDRRAAVLNGANPMQRKEVEELRETLAKQQEEHRGKELRLRLTVNRLKAMNEDLTKQVLEMQDEIRRYESCLLSALDGRENDFLTTPFSKRPYGEANDKHAHTLPCTTPKQLPTPVALEGRRRSSRSGSHGSMEENCEALDSMSVHEREQYSKVSTPRLLSEQAKVLSEVFNQPWKAAHRSAMEKAALSRAELGPRFAADWS